MKVEVKDICAGSIFAAFGAFFSINAWMNFDAGTAARVGPAYFPIALGVVLVCLGAIVVFQSLGKESSPIGRISWRGLFFTLIAAVSFGVSVEALGFVPSLALSVLLSAYASSKMRLLVALLLTVGLTCFCLLIFKVGLGLPLEPIGTLFH
jgi:hypothetical protein